MSSCKTQMRNKEIMITYNSVFTELPFLPQPPYVFDFYFFLIFLKKKIHALDWEWGRLSKCENLLIYEYKYPQKNTVTVLLNVLKILNLVILKREITKFLQKFNISGNSHKMLHIIMEYKLCNVSDIQKIIRKLVKQNSNLSVQSLY